MRRLGVSSLRNPLLGLMLAALLVACGDDDGDDAAPLGAIEARQTLTFGESAQTVVLGRGPTAVELQIPADVLPRRAPVTVQVESGLPARQGPAPVTQSAVHVATQGLTFAAPVQMRQTLALPQPGRMYVAVFLASTGTEWAVRGPARPIGQPEAGSARFELDVRGSGLWGFALAEASAPDGGAGPDGGAVDAGGGLDAAVVRDAAIADAAPVTVDAAADAPSGPTPDATPPGPQDAAADVAGDPVDAGAVDGAPATAAVPRLIEIEPKSGMPGMAVTLTVTGQGLRPGTLVLFDNTPLMTMVVAEDRLEAQVPANLVGNAGQFIVALAEEPRGPRSNVLYFTVTAPPGAPQIVDYNPDNGVAGDKIRIVGRNLAGEPLTITDARGLSVQAGAAGSTTWWRETLETVELVIPPGWSTGPLSVTNTKGTFRGKLFNVGRNLAVVDGAKASASSEYGGQWTIPRGADNDLVTSWFSAHGDCASLPPPTCRTVPFFQVTLAAPSTVARIAMRGNREYLDGYDFLRGRFDVLAGDVVLWSASLDLPQPDRDLDILLPTPLGGVTAVRFTSEKDESDEPGFAELQVFGP